MQPDMSRRDFMRNTALIGAAAVVLGNLIADLLYAVVDPRARSDR